MVGLKSRSLTERACPITLSYSSGFKSFQTSCLDSSTLVRLWEQLVLTFTANGEETAFM